MTRSGGFWVQCKRRARSFCIVSFVIFQLAFFVVRNPLDVWPTEIEGWVTSGERSGWLKPLVQWADRGTQRYASFTGCEQSWAMFRPPLSRSSEFLAVRLEFENSDPILLYSPNEPNPEYFFRLGGCRDRKLEEQLLSPPENLAESPERALWESTARAAGPWSTYSRENAKHPSRIVFLKRRFAIPPPDRNRDRAMSATVHVIAIFNEQGEIIR